MNVDKGEKVAGIWRTPQIPGIGIYKLAVKERLDGRFEWVHLQLRLDGTRKVLLLGEIASKDRLSAVLDVTNSTLLRIYGVIMQVAEFETSALDRMRFDGPVQ